MIPNPYTPIDVNHDEPGPGRREPLPLKEQAISRAMELMPITM
jgi:hypothetical protein